LHRDAAGRLHGFRLENKPAALQIERRISEEAFSARANDYPRQGCPLRRLGDRRVGQLRQTQPAHHETNLATSDAGFVGRLERELFEADFARSQGWTETKPVGWSDYIAKLFADQL
jgi:hypothetical protein